MAPGGEKSTLNADTIRQYETEYEGIFRDLSENPYGHYLNAGY